MMKAKTFHMMRAAAALALSVGLGLAVLPSTAGAQGPMGGVGTMKTATATVTVKAIDVSTRHMTVATAGGETFTVKVDPAVRNLDQIKIGDTIKATYQVETLFVLSKPNTPLPPDTETMVAARAAKGELPAAVVANHMVVTGAVIGVDQANHTLRLVDPQGGQVHTIDVTPENRGQLANVKAGDTITAFVTESLLLAVDRP